MKRSLGWAAALVSVASLMIAAPSTPLSDSAQAATCLPGVSDGGATITIDNTGDLLTTMRQLGGAGAPRTLLLCPGTYTLPAYNWKAGTAGRNVVSANAGTAASPIVVSASDTTTPPIIAGNINLVGASYWTLQYLHFIATQSSAYGQCPSNNTNPTVACGDCPDGNTSPGTRCYDGPPALNMSSGSNWTLIYDEFQGQTNWDGFAVLGVNGNASVPASNYTIRNSCFHHSSVKQHVQADGTAAGPLDQDPNKDHLLYLTLPPSSSSQAGGTITRNVFFQAPNGSAIKFNASRVNLTYNTLDRVTSALVIAENPAGNVPVTGDFVSRNLTSNLLDNDFGYNIFSTFQLDNNSGSVSPKAEVRDNWAYDSRTYDFISFDNPSTAYKGYVSPRTGQVTAASGPNYNSTFSCASSAYQPANSQAAAYGKGA